MVIDHTTRSGKRAKRIEVSHIPVEAGVYVIKNTVTGDCYIGGTEVLRVRCNQHSLLLLSGKHSCKAMQDSYDKHGAESFVIEALAVCAPGKVSAHELGWFKKISPSWNRRRPCHVRRSGGSLDYHKWQERKRLKLERESDLIAAAN